MKRATSHKLVVLAFCLAIALSTVLLIPATLNYLEFYVALGHMHLKISSFDIYTVFVGQFRDGVISANLSVIQNSSYVGLRVLSVDISVHYDASAEYSEVLFERKFTIIGDESIGPYSSLDLIMGNETHLEYFPLFAAYNNQSMIRGEPVTLRFSPTVNLYLLGNTVAEKVNLDDVIYTMPYYVT